MHLIKCLIIDDERLARAELEALLLEVGGCTILGASSGGEDAVALIQKSQPDLLFLDIDMPDLNGFELLARIDNPPQVVFVTAYDQFAIQAFEVRALDYLLKPVRIERLKDCLASIKQRLPIQLSYLDRLFVPQPSGGFFLSLADVYLIRSYGHYLRLYHKNSSSMVHRAMNTIERQLDPSQFFRINRSEIIRLSAVNKVNKISRGRYQFTVGAEQVTVSEARSVEWRKRFK